MLWLALILACSRQEPCDSSIYICDTAGSTTSSSPTETTGTVDTTNGTWIEVVRRPGCPVDPEHFVVSIRVRGAASSAYANIWSEESNGGFNETHPLTGQGPAGGAEDFSVEVRDGATFQQYQPGVATTYVCGEDDLNASLTWAIRVYDESGELADCAALSAEADAQAAVEAALTGNRDEPNPIPEREDLSVSNCTFWALPGQ